MLDLFGNRTKRRLLLSFSGGGTSGYMVFYMLFMWPDRDNWEMIVVFANTGKEDKGTLDFVRWCSELWNISIIWVEGYPSLKGKGWSVKHKIVDFVTASRNGEPFEAMIERLGIPSTNAPFCSDQLKRKTIESYLKSIGWKKYYKAIGIRADEMDRVNPKYKKKKILYPLLGPAIYPGVGRIEVGRPTTKQEVIEWWSQQSFGLTIDPDRGNCDNCWKKDLKRLCRNAVKYPDSFDWWKEMSTKYGHFNPRNTHLKPPFNFFRGNLSPWDIISVSKLPEDQITEKAAKERLDGCSESCEAF